MGRPGLLKPQSQRAFLYMCYRQQFLEYIENRRSAKICALPESPDRRRITKGFQPAAKAPQTARALPADTLRLLQPVLPHVGGNSS